MKFRKKPVVIEAVQWNGQNIDEIGVFIATDTESIGAATWGKDKDWLVIETFKGGTTVSIGDWIIKDAQGEFYICKSDIFDATYDQIEKGIS